MDVKTQTILFIVPSMEGGGSERVVSLIMQHLNRENFKIILVLLQKKGPYLKDIPIDIDMIDLKTPRLRHALISIPKIIKQKKPDIVFSTLSHLNIYLAMIRPFFSKNIKFIARESSIVSINNKNSPYPFLFDKLYSLFYNNFDLVIAQSNYMKDDLGTNYNINKSIIKVINNPVDIEKIEQLSHQDIQLFPHDTINLVAVGRLNPEKGYISLLHAFKNLSTGYTLSIIGEGPQETILNELIDTLQLHDTIKLLGFKSNPYPYMKQADIYVLPSKYEGFPNVILEAHSCGTPTLAYNCPGGTSEIIEEGLNGFLVECQNIEKLTQTIQKMATYDWSTSQIHDLTYHKYNVKKIIQLYEDTFKNL